MLKKILLVLVLLLIPLALAGTVERSFSAATVTRGETVDVTLAVTVEAGDSFYILEETFPTNWVVTANGNLDDGTAGQLKAVVMMSPVSTTYTYSVRAETASGSFTGTTAFGTAAPVATGGTTSVTVQAAASPQSLSTVEDSVSSAITSQSASAISAAETAIAALPAGADRTRLQKSLNAVRRVVAAGRTDVTVATDTDDYTRGDYVTFHSGFCSEPSAVRVLDPNGELVYTSHGDRNWQQSYGTNSDSSNGRYTVAVSCEDGNTYSTGFCVNDDGCVAVAPPDPDPVPSSSSSSSSSGGYSCPPIWGDCTFWSYCNSSLNRTRTCYDVSKCVLRDQPKREVEACSPCDESWICSLWSTCSAKQQKRQCYDEHKCGTITKKPNLQKTCGSGDSGFPPAQVVQQLPPPRFEAPAPVIEEESFWDKYKWWILGIIAALLLLLLLILLILHLKHKKQAFNIGELQEWIKKERAMGTSDADIKQILKDNTGWTDKEIEGAFKAPSSVAKPALKSPPSLKPGPPKLGTQPAKGI